MRDAVEGCSGRIDLLMETSWEVCNKIGGIYTVLSTKSKILKEQYGDRLVFIGPDVWSDKSPSPYFKDKSTLFKGFAKQSFPWNITVRCGIWDIPGAPQVILIKFDGIYEHLNSIFGDMWQQWGVDSMHEYGDYREGCAFAVGAAIVMKSLAKFLGVDGKNTITHFNEWTTGMGLLYLRTIFPEAATIFTTHATSIGRSICGNGKPLYDYFEGYHGDQMAAELNMEAKHSLEKTAAHLADCFTTVSEVTAKECRQLLDINPQVVTPNGFEPNFIPGDKKYKTLRNTGREKLSRIVEAIYGKKCQSDLLFVATSGRNEFRNKGVDVFIDSLKELHALHPSKEVIGLVLVPAWVKEPVPGLAEKIDLPENNTSASMSDEFMTHRLNNEYEDSITMTIKGLKAQGYFKDKIKILYVPCYLDGGDGIVNISYYDLLPAIDLTVFPSYYEPWGYTPLESVAFGIPTITTDKSGFGQWVLSNFVNSIHACGVKVIGRTDSNANEVAHEIASQIADMSREDTDTLRIIKKAASNTAVLADWKFFMTHYCDAFKIAESRRDMRLSDQ